jgi:uncharacterized membrane protein
MEAHDRLMDLGWWLCHQDPDRTMTFGGVVLPLCVRCTGLYLFMGLVLWCGLLAPPPGRWRRALALSATAAVLGCCVLFAQWTGAQLGWWLSNLANRLLTGMAAGAGIGWLLHAAATERLRSSSRRQKSFLPFLSLLALSFAVALALLLARPPWPAAGWTLALASLAGFYSSVGWGLAVVLSFIVTGDRGRPRTGAVAGLAAAGALALAVVLSVVRF